MNLSRRKFLQYSALVGGGCVALPAHGWSAGTTAQPAGKTGSSQPLPSREAFNGVKGAGFKVHPTSETSGAVWLRLMAIQDLDAIPSPDEPHGCTA